MKSKLTISIEQDLVPRAKRSARRKGLSLSSVIEQALTRLVEEDAPSFSSRWRGRFKINEQCDSESRMRELTAKYLGETRE